MMKIILLLLSLIALLVSAQQGGNNNNKRLIQFSPTHKEWLSEEEVERLVVQAGVHNFMDVTDYEYADFYEYKVNAIPIPTAPTHQAYLNKKIKN